MQDHKKSRRRATAWSEFAFMIVLVLLCVTLTALQYKWTGQISRAETALLQTSLNEGLLEFCQAFDAEISESRRALSPDGAEIEERGRQAAHLERFQAWKETGARPIYKRIGVAVPEGRHLELYEASADAKTLSAVPWPLEWEALRENLENKMPPGRASSFRDPTGLLTEFPVFGVRRRDGPPGGEIEWMIFELDRQYAQQTWIPQLAAKYLSPNVQGLLSRLEVRTVADPRQIIFIQGSTNAVKGKALSVTFNRQGSSGSRVPAPGGWWVLEALVQPGKIEDLVSAAQHRNLAVALVVNIAFLAAGLAFIRYTRRSRMLAEAQMQFVANVSHELRTPLTVIRAAGHNLLNGVVEDREKTREYVQLMVHHAEDLSKMVEQILDLGRAKRILELTAPQQADVAKAVTEAVAATAEETRGCTVDVHLSPALVTVSGDAGSLQRAFQNLIINAAKHGGKGGWIGITGITDEDNQPAMVEIQVADRGVGIPEPELAEIFEPFYRGAAADAGQIRGSGLGLSLVKEIIEAHGGNVSVQSQFNQGTTFTVRLPAANGRRRA